MDPGGKTDGVIIYANAASMLCGRLREFGGAKRHRGISGAAGVLGRRVHILVHLQTTRGRNLARAGRRFNRIFTDSYNKFSRLTLKKF